MMIGDLTRSQIEHLLNTQFVGRIACCDGDRPYVVPIAFVYQDGNIYGHSGIGQKVEMMRVNPNVCFEVEQVESLGHWESALLNGIYHELDGVEREDGLRLLVEHLAPAVTEDPAHSHPQDGPDVGSTMHFLDRSSRHGVVFRIAVTDMSGRYEKR